MAMKKGNASSAMEILALFDEAIRVNPTSPVLYINKASFLLQVGEAFFRRIDVVFSVCDIPFCPGPLRLLWKPTVDKSQVSPPSEVPRL